MANRKVKRNTSKQIISYTLDPEGTDSYGTVKFAASKTVYGKDGFNKVLYRHPIELVNADPSLELTIINEERLDLRNFTGFKDEFSARYELPPNDKKYYSYNQSYESATRPYGSTNLGFSKVVFGPPQTSPGIYTITKELIDSGNDLKLTYLIRSFDKREGQQPTNLNARQATAYLDRYPDLREFYKAYKVGGGYSTEALTSANGHWLSYGKTEKRMVLSPVGIDTRFQRIRKSSTDTSKASFGAQNTVTDDQNTVLAKRPIKHNGFNHSKTIIIKNQDMKEFDEWQIAGSCGTGNNAEVGYYVDSSFWDIELISN
jgi:hypothetical protein